MMNIKNSTKLSVIPYIPNPVGKISKKPVQGRRKWPYFFQSKKKKEIGSN